MPPIHHENFLQRFLPAQQELYAYIRSFGVSVSEAEDLLQESAMAMWRSYEQYDPGRPFGAWARAVSRNVVLNFLRQQRVRARTQIDSEICERIADVASFAIDEMRHELVEERQLMERCIQHLNEDYQRTLQLRYLEGRSIKQVAKSINKGYDATRVLLARIRAKLIDCVARTNKQRAGGVA